MAVFALVLYVVDCENGFDIAVYIVIAVYRIKVYGHHSRLPIVAVYNIGCKAYVRYNIKHRAREERKALGIVVMPVKPVTLEIILIIYKIVNNAVHMGFKYSAILPPPCNRHGYATNKIHFFAQLIGNTAVKRHNYAAAHKPFSERLGQCAGNVGKPARHCKWISLA